MTQMPAPRRVRRPNDKAEIIDRLIQDDSPFTTMRDVLIFAAAVGWSRKRRMSFDKSDEPIHWATMTTRTTTEPLINMLALSETDDVTILKDSRFDERVIVFEEYANGGLEVLGALLADSPKSAIDVLRILVGRSASSMQGESPSVDISHVDLQF